MTSTISIVTLAIHLVPKLNDMGFSLTGAGVVVSTYTAIAIVTQFVAGYIGDRVPKPPLIFVFLLFQAVSLLVLAEAEDRSMAFVFAVIYGFALGGRVPLMTADQRRLLRAQGVRHHHGALDAPQQLRHDGRPHILSGYMFDKTGTYEVPFLSFAALAFLGAFGMLFVRRPKSDRRDVGVSVAR